MEARDAGTVLRNWDRIKSGEQGREAGIFGEVPENLPGSSPRRSAVKPAAQRPRTNVRRSLPDASLSTSMTPRRATRANHSGTRTATAPA